MKNLPIFEPKPALILNNKIAPAPSTIMRAEPLFSSVTSSGQPNDEDSLIHSSIFKKGTPYASVIRSQIVEPVRRPEHSEPEPQKPQPLLFFQSKVVPENEIIVINSQILDADGKTHFECLGNLYELLACLFCAVKKPEKVFELSTAEREILALILKRKGGTKSSAIDAVTAKEVNLDFLSAQLSQLKSKRPEECHKFIFSRGFKHIQKTFELACRNKTGTPLDFYEVYFSEVVASNPGLTLANFYNPISTKVGASMSKLNQEYFALIFRSKRFMTEFANYMYKDLITEYQKEICKKLEILLRKWDSSDPKTIDMKNVAEYLLRNKKCKLPWTVEEVKNSIESFVATIEAKLPDVKIAPETPPKP